MRNPRRSGKEGTDQCPCVSYTPDHKNYYSRENGYWLITSRLIITQEDGYWSIPSLYTSLKFLLAVARTRRNRTNGLWLRHSYVQFSIIPLFSFILLALQPLTGPITEKRRFFLARLPRNAQRDRALKFGAPRQRRGERLESHSPSKRLPLDCLHRSLLSSSFPPRVIRTENLRWAGREFIKAVAFSIETEVNPVSNPEKGRACSCHN